MWPFRKKIIVASSDGDANYYDRWISDIVRDQGSDVRSLLEHVKHHADEGLENGVDWSWVSSILNLIDIITRHQGEPVPSILQRIHRLYHHWREDPYKMTPPPSRMPPSVRDFLKLKLESPGTVIKETSSAAGAVPGPESMGYKPDHPGLVHHSETEGKDVWCPTVGRSS